jgi:hypothetical protein
MNTGPHAERRHPRRDRSNVLLVDDEQLDSTPFWGPLKRISGISV